MKTIVNASLLLLPLWLLLLAFLPTNGIAAGYHEYESLSLVPPSSSINTFAKINKRHTTKLSSRSFSLSSSSSSSSLLLMKRNTLGPNLDATKNRVLLQLRGGNVSSTTQSTTPVPARRGRRHSAGSSVVWLFPPIVIFIGSFFSYGWIRRVFHSILGDSMYEKTATQVATWIALVFATLVTNTISTLQTRQYHIQKSFLLEITSLEKLTALLTSSSSLAAFDETERTVMMDCVELMIGKLKRECVRPLSTTKSNKQQQQQRYPFEYMKASDPGQLLGFCDQIERNVHASPRPGRHREESSLTKIRTLMQDMQQERVNRYIAMTSMMMTVPPAQLVLLGIMAVSILVSFLAATATDYPEMLSLVQRKGGQKIRVLWSILVTCFTLLALLIRDLATVVLDIHAIPDKDET